MGNIVIDRTKELRRKLNLLIEDSIELESFFKFFKAITNGCIVFFVMIYSKI